MNEVLNDNIDKIKNSDILNRLKLKKKKYFVVSFHRQENVDNSQNLRKIINVLNAIAEEYKIPIIVSTHPRTKNRLESQKINIDPRIKFLKPFGFFDYVNLEINSLCSISDSGTISEESAILSFPAISLRESMERPEAQDSGSIVLTGFDTDIVLSAIETTITEFREKNKIDTPTDYQIKNFSLRVLKLIIGNTKLSNKWAGIENIFN
jgi:UDP-N-acetyl-L-fucosamine synthase